jgi:hypothetical protein
LSAGSLLVGVDYIGAVVTPYRFSNWRATLKESQVFKDLGFVARGQLTGAKFENYQRLELCIQSLGQMIILAVPDMKDASLIKSFYQLKLWAITKAFPSDRTLDRVTEYFKWLNKVAAALFLGQKPPSPSPLETKVDEDGNLLPFTGQLQFISDFWKEGRRRRQMCTSEARALAQVANLSRALAYPSKEQAKKTVTESVKTFQESKRSDPKSLAKYRRGLQAQLSALGNPKVTKTHVSLISSASAESSRSEGGRSKVLVDFTKQYSELPINFETLAWLAGRVDQFGQTIITDHCVEYAKLLLNHKVYTRNPTYGDILFVRTSDLDKVWDENLSRRSVPKQLGHLLNLTASALILEVGSYEPRPEFRDGIMSFPAGSKPVFTLTGQIRVRAGLSIEAGLKARLTTAATAAYAHLSQLPSNALREVLSQDPFLKVGFQESEKLWEVLKAYRSAHADR